jgi:serine/threonine protein phosphatase 1
MQKSPNLSDLNKFHLENNIYSFKMKNQFKKVFVGHTPTQYFNESIPQKQANIWNLDTGCGKGEDCKLTIMNLKTEEHWQSDQIGELYK